MASGVDRLTDQGKLLFGAGFAFGVMVTMLILGVVFAIALPGDPDVLAAVQSPLLVTVLAGIVFAAIVGLGLSLLAFPETRTKIPADPERFDRSSDDE